MTIELLDEDDLFGPITNEEMNMIDEHVLRDRST